MHWKVPFINLGQQFINQKEELVSAFNRIMESGSFILRDDVNIFEKNMASFLNVKNVVGVNSGSDALILAAKMLGLKNHHVLYENKSNSVVFAKGLRKTATRTLLFWPRLYSGSGWPISRPGPCCCSKDY